MRNIRFLTRVPILLILFGAFAFAQTSTALTCSEVRQLTLLYFKMHFSHHQFTDELSQRTLENFVKAWDPGKLYFFKSDVEEFKKKFADKLDDQIYGNMDCSAIDKVMNRYSKRFEERQKNIGKLVDAKYDFSKEEYLKVDREAIDYPATLEEVNERWRKRVKFQLLTLKTSLDGDMEKARKKLHKRYDLAVKRHNDLTKDRVFGIFLNAFSTALDPHSSYMPADELEDFRIRTRLSLEGIGASLRSEDGFTIVASLVKGGAAEKSGQLEVGDKIIAVAQGDGEPVDVIDMDLQEVVKKIRGARGTTVKLTVIREDAKKTRKMVIPIVREKIQLVEQQASSEIIDLSVTGEDGKAKTVKVGVLTLPSFYIDFEGRQKRRKNYRSSSNDTRQELQKLKKADVDAVIMDLRNNGGGSLEESIKVAGLFFDEGPVVQIKARNGETETYEDPDPKTWYDGPLVVMINRHSASASEIFAGAIQDYQRGLIVGDSHTFGKGTVQNLNDLAPQLGAIKVTVNQFYRASGISTQMQGVEADIVLPSLVDQLEIGEKYYDFALPYEKIETAKFKKWKMVEPYLEPVQKRFASRTEKSEDFKEVRDEIDEYIDNKEERSRVSLREKDHQAEDDVADKGDDESEEDEVSARNMATNEANLKDDIYLQEALRITADYAWLAGGNKLADMPTIPMLVAEKEEKSKKPQAITQNKKSSEKKAAVKSDQ